jgi:hypothetical protein
MHGLPSAILGDQRELASLPEASVSNRTQAFSLFADAMGAWRSVSAAGVRCVAENTRSYQEGV